MKQLIGLFSDFTGKKNPSIEVLPTSGSTRKYYRLQSNNISLIGVHGESVDENREFICLGRHDMGRGLNVPEVLAISDDDMVYIQQDVEDTVLFHTIKGGRLTGVYSHQEKELLHKTIYSLADFQIKGAQ